MSYVQYTFEWILGRKYSILEAEPIYCKNLQTLGNKMYLFPLIKMIKKEGKHILVQKSTFLVNSIQVHCQFCKIERLGTLHSSCKTLAVLPTKRVQFPCRSDFYVKSICVNLVFQNLLLWLFLHLWNLVMVTIKLQNI